MKIIFFLLVLILLFLCNIALYSQGWMPVIINERGDTIHYTWPPPDSTYSQKELIIRFRKTALNLENLCYNYDYISDEKTGKKKDKPLSFFISDSLISALMAQRFDLDYLITNPELVTTILSFGASSLRRMIWANPCKDTLSLTRTGDTIICDDYLWMVLEFEFDVNVIDIAYLLTIFFQSDIVIADLDYYLYSNIKPYDQYYVSKQKSLQSSMSSVERAWDFQKGNYEIKVAVLDDGIDYNHPDFGGKKGSGEKISFVYNFWDASTTFSGNAQTPFGSHGTPVAGIIGAITGGSNTFGIAGIGGGWASENKKGLQILSYNVTGALGKSKFEDYINGALRAASSRSVNSPYGNGCHVINMSFGNDKYSASMKAALMCAYQNGVSLVASAGNESSTNTNIIPANYDPSTIIDVGAADYQKNRIGYSNYNKNIDIIAPGGCDNDLRYSEGCSETSNSFVFTDYPLYFTTPYSTTFGYFAGTSAAAPHVAGVVGLLRSEALDRVYNNSPGLWYNLEPEDYEGMIKASAEDGTLTDFDIETGWGFLRADNIFEMLFGGYEISHFQSTDISSSTDWSVVSGTFFFNENLNISDWSSTFVSQACYAKQKTYFGEIVMPSNSWTNDNRYVWGRKGNGNIGGYSAANPNFQVRYTEVISGDGDGNNLVPNLKHNNSSTVTLKTYQYDLYDLNNNHIGIFPPSNELGFNISVFAKKTVTRIEEHNIDYDLISIYPNPFNEQFSIKLEKEIFSKGLIQVFDLNGNLFLEQTLGQHSLNLNQTIMTTNLPQGIYLLKCSINNKISYYKLIKRG
ncbi:MAG: Peptidase protein [Ignavibacteria bacterium]|nr:Peptidase protein [Ignavibacteria bacterium]